MLTLDNARQRSRLLAGAKLRSLAPSRAGRKRRGRLLIFAGCVAALLSGCAHYEPAPIAPEQRAVAFEARSLVDLRLQKFIAAALGAAEPGKSAAVRSWNLARLTLAALYYHPDLDIARAKAEAARAAVLTASQRPNPTLNLAAVFGAGAAAAAIPAGAAPMTIGPVIDFVIEGSDKREYRSAKARHLADAAREDLATAAWQVHGRVRGALLDLWAAQRRESLMRRRLALQDERVGLLESRLASGAASSPDVSRERVVRAQSALALGDSERALADARARLASAIGIPLAALDGISLSLDAFERPTAPIAGAAAGDLRRRALTGRSDIAAALAAYEAAQSAVQLAIAEQYPNVTLGPGYQYDFGVNKYLLGPSVTLPLFNRTEGPIAEAIAARREAAARFDALQAGVIGAIDRAAADATAAGAAVTTGDALVADARRRAAQVQQSFAAGRADRPSLVAAELEQIAAELARFDAVVAQRRALGDAEDALHDPLFEPAAPFIAPQEDPRHAAEPGV